MVKLPQRGQSWLSPPAMDCRPPNVWRVEPYPSTGESSAPETAFAVRYSLTPLDFPWSRRWDTMVPNGVTASVAASALAATATPPSAQNRPRSAIRTATATAMTARPIQSPRLSEYTTGTSATADTTRPSNRARREAEHATANHPTRRQTSLPHVFVYPQGAAGRGVWCPSTSITCAPAGRTTDCTKPLVRKRCGNSSSIGEENPKCPAKTPSSPPATVTTNSQPSSRTNRRRGSSASVRLPAYSSSTVSATYSTSRKLTEINRLDAVPATVPGGATPSAPMLTTTTPRNASQSANPGGSAIGRPARRWRSRITAIGTAAIGKISTPRPSAHHSGDSRRMPVNGQPGRSGRRCGVRGSVIPSPSPRYVRTPPSSRRAGRDPALWVAYPRVC